MDELEEKYYEYLRLKDCKAVYELENGTLLDFIYKEENFPHLLGLHKLTDLQLIQFMNDKANFTVTAKTIIKQIKRARFTSVNVYASSQFYKIQERYESFSYDNLATLTYTDAVIDFNAASISSALKSNYILFEKKKESGYNHLGIALDVSGTYRYVETFFHEPTSKYITGQTLVKVKGFTLYDSAGKIIVADSFR